ncbi:hypothetical protein GCM10009836_54620 [Pseudonocardia ailaonensis]|uniref:PucR C-terminal helix-turn-helix domain-containing protein n=1 Tax=Pseudonocardia ailaonensis TaxID=367279 RepID=A0ABN2NH06_9PSEU
MPGEEHRARLGSLLQPFVDDLHEDIRRSLAVTDTGIWLLSFSTQEPELDAGRSAAILNRRASAPARRYVAQFDIGEEPVRIPASAAHDIPLDRVGVMIRTPQGPVGFMWIIDRPPMSDADLAVVRRAVARMGSAVHAFWLANPEVLASRHQALFGDDRYARSQAWSALRSTGGVPRGPWRVAFTHGTDGPFEHPPQGTAVVLLSDAVVTVTPEGAPLWCEGSGTGLSEVGHQPDELPRRLAQARYAHEVAVLERRDAALRWEDLGTWLLLAAVPRTADAMDTLSPGVTTLLRHADPALVDTARVIAEHGGRMAVAARELHIHRATLYQRLERINDLLGPGWHEGWRGLGVLAALRLSQLGESVLASHPA